MAGLDSSSEPSFVPDAAPDVDVGDQVRHPVFGSGTITSLDGDMAVIKFARGDKLLNLAFAPLEKT